VFRSWPNGWINNLRAQTHRSKQHTTFSGPFVLSWCTGKKILKHLILGF